MTDIVKSDKILTLPIRISLVILIIGAMFKIQHWQYSNWIITLAYSLIALFYFFRFLNKTSKTSLDFVKLGLVVLWSFNGIFTILHLPYKMVFAIGTWIFILAWLIMGGLKDYYSNKGFLYRVFNISIMTVAMVIVSIGAIFKIQHWPGANLLLISGLSIGAVWFIVDFFKKENNNK